MGKRVFHLVVGNTVRTVSQSDLLRVHYFRKKQTPKLPRYREDGFQLKMRKSESVSTDVSMEAEQTHHFDQNDA